MQEKIADNSLRGPGRRRSKPFGGVGNFNVDAPAQDIEPFADLRVKCFQPVHQRRVRAGPVRLQTARDAQEKMPVAGAEFDNATRVPAIRTFPQGARHEAWVSHPGVHPSQIAAAAQGAPVLRRQNVQQFGFNQPFHKSRCQMPGAVLVIPPLTTRRGN